jgi:hypothetical protein
MPDEEMANTYRTITSKLNGLAWSDDGMYLYVATQRRVLMYTVISTVPSLKDLAVSKCIKTGLDKEDEYAKDAVDDWKSGKKWLGHWEKLN